MVPGNSGWEIHRKTIAFFRTNMFMYMSENETDSRSHRRSSGWSESSPGMVWDPAAESQPARIRALCRASMTARRSREPPANRRDYGGTQLGKAMRYGIKLHVWGDLACFTSPEMKVERVSYDVITPSAARGIVEAIYWKTANSVGRGPATRPPTDPVHESPPKRGQRENIVCPRRYRDEKRKWQPWSLR
jgi:CRISPR-associated Cas5-like protein